MQTRTIINKIRWIRSQLSDELEEWLFFNVSSRSEVKVIPSIVNASRFSELVSRDAAAVQILDAFGLHPLVDRQEFHGLVFDLASGRREVNEREKEKGHQTLAEDPLGLAWQNMIGAVDPIEKLTTPEEMRTPELPETFISFEIASIAEENTPLSRLVKATAFAEEAYEIGQLYM